MANDAFLRMTNQRRIILRELRKVNTHPSADEVYDMVRQYLPRISLGTVYRNLEVLSQIGEIQKIEVGGSIKRFDGNTKPHYHVRCMACDRIEDVPESIRFDFGDQIDQTMHYKIMEHRLEFIGLCPECAARQADRMMANIDRQIGKRVSTGI
ncbi:MAG: transcriptional repressor [Thermodesulfobacteriota bacterium]